MKKTKIAFTCVLLLSMSSFVLGCQSKTETPSAKASGAAQVASTVTPKLRLTPYLSTSFGDWEASTRFVEKQLESGALKQVDPAFERRLILSVEDIELLESQQPSLHEFITRGEGGAGSIVVNGTTYAVFSDKLKQKALDQLTAELYGVPVYRALVPIDAVPASRFKRIKRLRKDGILSDRDHVPAEWLLTPFVSQWAHRSNPQTGPNCFGAALASVLREYDAPREVSEEEFLSVLKERFELVSDDGALGDLVTFHDPKTGELVHAATYIGVDERNPKQHIVFTKNGKGGGGSYVFMSTRTLMTHPSLYAGTSAIFWRLR